MKGPGGRRCLAAAIVLVVSVGAAQAERRVALVIGNSKYRSVAQLPNPANDARLMVATLASAKFEVIEARQDLAVNDLRAALRDFGDRVVDADIAVVYFAGHGIEVGGTNYLIPTDAKLARDTDVEDEAVSLDRVLRALEPARQLRLVILDACRDNPFIPRMRRVSASRGIGRGLAKVEPDAGDTLVAFATRAGDTAEDGDTNSPFARALANHLITPGLDIRLALGRVRDEVRTLTSRKQEPFYTGSLGGATVSLSPALPTPAPPPVAAAPPAPPAPDGALLDLIGALSDRTMLTRLSESPNPAVGQAARQRLAALPGAAPPVAASPAPSAKSGPVPAAGRPATPADPMIAAATSDGPVRTEPPSKPLFDRLAEYWSKPAPEIDRTATPAPAPALPEVKQAALASTTMPDRPKSMADAPRRTISAHRVVVLSVAASPDGRTIASASADKTLKLWDAETGKELRVLSGHNGPVNAVAFSPDGRTIASASADKTVKLWDVASGRLLRTLSGHIDEVLAVAFSPDGRMLVSGGRDYDLRMWQSQSGHLRTTLPQSQFGSLPVRAVAFSPDGKTLVSASASQINPLAFWDAATGRHLSGWEGYGTGADAVAYSPDGRQIVSALDGLITIRDVASGKELQTIHGHTRVAWTLAFSPSGTTLVSAAVDAVRMWDAATGRELRTFPGQSRSMALSPDGRTIFSGGLDGTLTLWDASPSDTAVSVRQR